jgi:DNA-binding transcriptional regulator YdaS (Cro superfamily)
MTSEDRLTLLREAVAREGSQSKVAKRLGYSSTAISQALSNSYGGSLDILLTMVEEVYGTRVVSCPVLGEIVFPQCVLERRRPFSTSNPHRVKMYKACKSCDFNTDVTEP